MDIFNIQFWWSSIWILLILSSHCWSEECIIEEVRSCLRPSLNYIQNVSNIYGRPHGGILQTTLNYFFTSDYNEYSTYHILSFETMISRLDEIFKHSSKLDKGCGLFTEAENCLFLTKQWCDKEVRGIVEGIENGFNFICHKEYMKVFRVNQGCIVGSVMENARYACNRDFIQSLNTLGDTITKYQHEWHMRKENLDGAGEAKVIKLCQSVKKVLTCYKDSTKKICGEASAQWEYRIRHDMVQLLISDVCGEQDDYDYLESLILKECLVCTSGEKCVPTNLTCDGYKHCTDGSDESHALCGHHWGTVDIILITVGIIIIITITIICVVKYRESIEYTLKHRLQCRSREMQVFRNEDEEIHTRVSPQNRPFHYREYEQLKANEDISDMQNV